MNSQGGRAGQVDERNTNNQNFTSHPSLESLQTTLLPLFPVTTESEERFLEGLPLPIMNLPQEGLTNISVNESMNLAMGSNISSSSSISRTPQNPSTNLDLSLTIGLAHQGHEVQVQRVHGGTSSNSIILPSRSNSTTCASRGFFRGESSNMGEEGPPTKQHVTKFHVGANNNLNPSLPPPERHVPQILSANPPIERTQSHDHVNPHNGTTPTPQPQYNLYDNMIEDNFGIGAQGQLQHYYLSSSGSLHHDLQPLPNLHIGLPSTFNVSTRNTHQVIVPPYHETLGDIMAPLRGHMNFQGGNMFGLNVHQTTMYHPPSLQVGPSTFDSSHGTQEMSCATATSSSISHNYHNEFVIPTLQPRVSHGTFLPQQFFSNDMRRRFPAEDQYIFNQPMAHIPMFRGVMFEIPTLTYVEHGAEGQSPLGLSTEAIMGNIRRENFTSTIGTENPDDEEKCAICLEVYEDGDEIGKLDLCVHKFHVQCIKQWLMQRNVCPICKRVALAINDIQNEVGDAVNNQIANA